MSLILAIAVAWVVVAVAWVVVVAVWVVVVGIAMIRTLRNLKHPALLVCEPQCAFFPFGNNGIYIR